MTVAAEAHGARPGCPSAIVGEDMPEACLGGEELQAARAVVQGVELVATGRVRCFLARSGVTMDSTERSQERLI